MRNPQIQIHPQLTPASAAALALPAVIATAALGAFLFQRIQTRSAPNSVVRTAQAYTSLSTPEMGASPEDLHRSKVRYALSLLETLETQAAASPTSSVSVSSTDLHILRGAFRAARLGVPAAVTDLP